MGLTYTLYQPRESSLHRWHPLTKLVLALTGVAASLLLPGAWPNYAVFVVLLLPLAAWGRVFTAFLRATWRVWWPFALSIILIQGLFWTNGTPLAALGPLSLKAEGLRFAAISVGRILLLIGSFTLMTMTTRPDALMIALTDQGMPQNLAYAVLTAIQIVPRFQAKANKIVDAQRSRGLDTSGNILRRARALLPLVEPLILGSLLDVEERAIALEARGFGRKTKPTSLIRLADTTGQRVLRWLLLALIPILVVARVWWW